jgi:hypothetical protein
VDIDATIVIAHSDKEKAAPTLKVTGIARGVLPLPPPDLWRD